jgi:nucleoside-diphosphate-sugar epimerase
LITDNSRIEELGVDVSVDLEEGLDALYKWYQEEAV